MKWADPSMIKAQTSKMFTELYGDRYVKNKKQKQVDIPTSIFDTFELYNPSDNPTNNPTVLAEHLRNTGGIVITRFPPEPNGYLHIGHCKAMFINFGYALKKDGICYLRFDDTNPINEDHEYVNSIIEDVEWMGYKPYKITYTSDYFDKLIDFAFTLIKNNRAYVCHLSSDELREQRLNGIHSPDRDRPINESVNLFQKMLAGELSEGAYTLRLKMDMLSGNPNMRDPVAYRIINKPHVRTGDRYKVYPSYDYSHCVVDSLENVTHSLCTMEFQSRNECYQWILDALDVYHPNQIEYSRLNITHVVLSKRKLLKLINNGLMDGWDDPRLPTIKGLRRRGYTKEAIQMFCDNVGVNIGGSSNLVHYEKLEHYIRRDLDSKAPRRMVVLNPLKITLINWSSEKSQLVAKDFPDIGEESATRSISTSPDIYIDQSDFRLDPSENFYRLKIGGIVRLKYAYPIKCIGNRVGSNGEIVSLYAEILYDYSNKIKGTINWVSTDSCINMEVREYAHLFPANMSTDEEWIKDINMDSKTIYNAVGELCLKSADIGDRYQFERFGYYIMDKDSNENKYVFNKIVDLKESKDKPK